MKIIVPVNSIEETKEVIRSGADEVYCGVLPVQWSGKYPSIISPNARPGKSANLQSFDELREVVAIAHKDNIPVRLAINSFYSEKELGFIQEQIEYAQRVKVDALIVSDIGLLDSLKKKEVDLAIHLSTLGTAFNSWSVKFYKNLGVANIVLPRHLRLDEIGRLVKDFPDFEFETIILGSACRNTFCAFIHGIQPHRQQSRNLIKKLNIYYHFTNLIRRLPGDWAHRIVKIADNFSEKSAACLFNHKIFPDSDFIDKREERSVLKKIDCLINNCSDFDVCGACRLLELSRMGIRGVKLAQRNYPITKKINDILFIKTLLSAIDGRKFGEKEFYRFTRGVYKQINKVNCSGYCYYPDGM